MLAKTPFDRSFYAPKTATREGKEKLSSTSKGRLLVFLQPNILNPLVYVKQISKFQNVTQLSKTYRVSDRQSQKVVTL